MWAPMSSLKLPGSSWPAPRLGPLPRPPRCGEPGCRERARVPPAPGCSGCPPRLCPWDWWGPACRPQQGQGLPAGTERWEVASGCAVPSVRLGCGWAQRPRAPQHLSRARWSVCRPGLGRAAVTGPAPDQLWVARGRPPPASAGRWASLLLSVLSQRATTKSPSTPTTWSPTSR